MTTISTRLIVWIPRFIGIAFVVFLSLFALDVFNERLSFVQTILALGMHLIPSAIMLIVLTLAWRWPTVGALLFFAAGVLYSLSVWQSHPSWIPVIAGPLFVVAILFFVSARYGRTARRLV